MDMPRGLRAKGDTGIEIEIRFKGKRYRPTLSLDPSFKRNVNAAEASYRAIRDVIAREKIGRATEEDVLKVVRENVDATFSFGKNERNATTVGGLLGAWLEMKRVGSANTTIRDFLLYIREFNERWEELPADKLTVDMIKAWILECQKNGRSLKFIKNIIVPLRGALDEAEDSGTIPFNPVSKIKWNKFAPTESERLNRKKKKVFPLAWDEIDTILDKAEESMRNLIVICIGLGLRINEVLALAWEDVDLNIGKLNIVRGVVSHKLTTLKTEESGATIDLSEFPHVLEAMKCQKKLTYMKPEVDCGVYGKLHFMFYHPVFNRPFTDSDQFLKGVWKPLLRKAGVRARPAMQMRHTFVVQARVSGKPDLWIAKITRHTTTHMIERNYGKEWPAGGTAEEVKRQYDIERWKVSDQKVTKRSSN